MWTSREVARARILYIEGYLWDEDKAKDASRKAIAAVKGAGGRVALTLSDAFCVGRFRDEFLHLLDKDVNILFANEDEAKALFEAEDFADVVEGAKKWGGIAALTRSAKGCVMVEGGVVHEIPAAPVARVIDTTGAGDQFAAGFLYGLTHGKGLADCGRLGALAAAEVISALRRAAGSIAQGTGDEGRAYLVTFTGQGPEAPIQGASQMRVTCRWAPPGVCGAVRRMLEDVDIACQVPSTGLPFASRGIPMRGLGPCRTDVRRHVGPGPSAVWR